MKLLYCGHGDNYHITKWIRSLHEAGISVHLATFQPPTEPDLPAEVHQLHTLFYHLRYTDFLASANRLHDIINRIQPDVLFASFANTYGLMASLTGFRPRVIQTWSRDIGIPEMQSKRELLMNYLTGFPVLERADGITTDGMAYKDLLLQQKPQWKPKTLGTPWGIRLSDFEIDESDRHRGYQLCDVPENAGIITSVRGVYWYYQPDLIIKGMLKFLNHNPDYFGVILTLNQTRTPETQSLLDSARRHDRIRIIDRFLDKSEIRSIWAITEAFISAPLNDGVSEAISEGRYTGSIPVLNPIPSNIERATDRQHTLYFPTISPSPEQVTDTLNNVVRLTENQKAEIRNKNRDWVKRHASVEDTIASLTRFLYRIHQKYRSA